MEGLKESLFTLMAQHHNIEHVLDEVQDTNRENRISTDPTAKESTPNVEAILKSIGDQADATSTPVAMVAASVMADRIKQCWCGHGDDLLLDQERRVDLEGAFSVAQKIQKASSFSRNLFIKILNKQGAIPIEAIWRLHSLNLMTLDNFITCNLSKPKVIGKVASQTARLCEAGCGRTLELRTQIVKDITTHLICQAYGDQNAEDSMSKGLKKVCCALMESVTKKVIVKEELEINPFEVILTQSNLVKMEKKTFRKYASRQLSLALSLNPVLKVSEALQKQREWTFKAESSVTNSFVQLLTLFSAAEAIVFLQQVLDQHEVNWQLLLTYCSTLVVCHQAAPPLLLQMIQRLLQDALDNSQLDGLVAGFLLARQACGEGPHVFPTYQEWFQTTFGEGGKCATTNKKSFVFLMKFLTDIVPFEQPNFLKAHIIKPLCVPAKCRVILNDYLILAKTRLTDLKEPIDDLGIYEESNTSEKDKTSHKVDQDIAKTLQSFERTGKVPASIMEASIFRKPYFVGKFLPTLLAPRPLPDPPDVKMKFITELQKAEKIPPSLYKTYAGACSKLATQLLEGVFDDEDGMDDMLLSPRQQVSNALSSFKQTVLSNEKSTDLKSGLSIQIAALNEKISNVLNHEQVVGVVRNTDSQSALSMDHPNLSKYCLELAEEMLQVVCELDLMLDQKRIFRPEWKLQLLTMLSRHGQLWKATCGRILELITKQFGDVEPYHIRSLAYTFVHLCTYQELLGLPLVVLEGTTRTYVHTFCTVATPTCRHHMTFLLQFCFYYLKCSFCCFDGIRLPYTQRSVHIPPHVVKMFSYLVERLAPGDNEGYIKTTHFGDVSASFASVISSAREVYESRAFQQVHRANQLSLKEWLQLEKAVDPAADFLRPDDRQGYLRNQILMKYTQDSITTPLSKLCDVWLAIDDQSYCGPYRGVSGCVCRQKTSLKTNSSMELLILLQHLVTMVHNTQDGLPWLPTYMSKHLLDSGTLCSSEDTERLFILARYMPPYMMFVNVLHPPLPPDGTTVALDIVNTSWRNHLTTGVFLTRDATCYIMQGLLQLPVELSSLVVEILDKCPALLPSVVVHWPSISALVTCVTREKALSPSQDLLCRLPPGLHSSITSLRTREMETGIICSDLGSDAWLLGVAVYSQITQCLDKVDQWCDFLGEWAELTKEQVTSQLPITTCVLCLLAKIAWQSLYEQDPHPSLLGLLQRVFNEHPDTLLCCMRSTQPSDQSCPDGPQARMPVLDILPSVTRNILCGTLARFLICLPDDCVGHIGRSRRGLQTIVQTYVMCTKLYDSSDPADGAAAKLEVQLSQAVPVHILTNLASVVHTTILSAQVSDVKSLPQELVLSCQPDLKQIIKSVLTKGSSILK